MRGPVLLLLLALLGSGPSATARDDPFECPIRALLFENDAGLARVYDGIRRGLEQAHLPRICLERADGPEGPDEVLDRLAREGTPLLFVLGRATERIVGGRLADVPRVVVTTTWYAGETPVEPAPEQEASSWAHVDALLSSARLREVLSGMFPGLVVRAAGPGGPADRRAPLLAAAGVRAAGTGRPDVFLDLDLGGGRAVPPTGLPLLSDDVGRWGSGAAVVVVPDHLLLGRVAADAGRRLLGGAEPLIHTRFSTTEVRVDLQAAATSGFSPPLAFLAGADLIRRGAP